MKDQIIKLVKDLLHSNVRFVELKEYSKYDTRKSGISFLGDILSSIHDKYKDLNQEEHKDYFPENIFKEDIRFKTINNHPTRFNFVQKIDDNIDILIESFYSEYSSNKTFTLRVGISFYDLMIPFYKYKSDSQNNSYKIEMIYESMDILKSLDLKDFTDNPNYKSYLPEYGFFRDFEYANYDEIFKLCIDDNNVFHYHSMLKYSIDNMYGGSKNNGSIPKDFFIKNNIKKCIMHTVFFVETFNYDLPNDFVIEIDLIPSEDKNDFFEKNWKTKEKLERVIQNIDIKNRCYIEEKHQVLAQKLTVKEDKTELYETQIILDFKYENIIGSILTNKYAYQLFKEHYEKQKNIVLNFGGFEKEFTYSDFIKLFKERKKEPKSKDIKAYEYFDNKIGYCDFWNKKFDKYVE